MKLELNGLMVECVIGELPDERVRLQPLTIDLKLEIPDDAAETDAIEDTVDYAELSSAIRDSLVEAKCRMIERAAKLTADVVMRDPRVKGCEVRVEKAGAIPGLRSAAAIWSARR